MASFACFASTALAATRLFGALAALALTIGWVAPSIAQPTNADPVAVELSALPSVLAQFTTAIEDREPIDQVTFVSSERRKIYLFSDLRGLSGQTVTHRWLFAGKIMAEIPFEIRGPRWRVWSSKALREDWLGDWTVEIVGGDGEVIAAETFTYSAPGA